MTNSSEWSPIEPLSQGDRQVDLGELDSLQTAWKAVQDDLKQSGAKQLRDFREKLMRSWSIETGIIERLYDLDEGTTQTLVESGFVASLVDRASTNVEPSDLISILNDQREAAEFVVGVVRDKQALTRHLLLEMHSLLTRHQPTTEGMTPGGNIVSIPLLRGEFKKQPNNPTRPDGIVHHYCPPTQVIGEIDRLLEWLEEYRDVHPLLVAAWLHHRFAQIHPFQDGNGRVSRCLVTLVLLRGDWLPLVVSRHHRTPYIAALESADVGDLHPLIRLFADLEQDVLIKAVSSAGATELLPQNTTSTAPNLAQQVAQGIASKLRLRKEKERAALRGVNHLAEQLLEDAQAITNNLLEGVTRVLSSQSATAFELIPARFQDEGGPHVREREYYYRTQVVGSARAIGHWANFNEAYYWFRRVLRGESSRLTFVVSFHHIGQELTGVMEATCFAQIHDELSEATADSRRDSSCTTRPFTFTWQDDVETVRKRLEPWLNECLSVALRGWGETL